jgi:DmsE family decaheme c-type cytochrome
MVGAVELCESCHRDHRFDEWAFSEHRTAGLTCASCHTIHKKLELDQTENTSDLCYKCHGDVKAAFMMPSHHPLAEGKLECDDCHAVHGGKPEMSLAEDSRELCFGCHAEKEGPFVYEHAPVVEDCQICHEPHGAVADNLLKQAEPSLCLNCHSMHFHATVEGVDGSFDVPQAPERAGVSTPDAWKRGLLTKCTQCHTEIHGSDLPSQAISTGGNALTR